MTQLDAGTGVDGFVMLGGSLSRGFALGGTVGLSYLPRLDVDWDQGALKSHRDGGLALYLGPSVDYYPNDNFHIGGLIGYANEAVPKFNPTGTGTEHVSSYTMVLWLGFDFAVAHELALGIALKAQFYSGVPRRSDVSGTEGDSALSLGLGVTAVSF